MIYKSLILENCLMNFNLNNEIFKDFEFLRKNYTLVIDLLISLIQLKPLNIPKYIDIILKIIDIYKNNIFDIKELIFDKSILITPFIIYKLYNNNIYTKNYILNNKFVNNLIISYFPEIFPLKFRKALLYNVSEKDFTIIFSNKNLLYEKIEFGFFKNSLGYILKYDEINLFQEIDNIYSKKIKINVDVFEFSLKIGIYSLISFSAFFGSLKCFKHLILKNYPISDDTYQNLISSGNIELIYLFDLQNYLFNLDRNCKISLYYKNFDIFQWLFNNIKSKIEFDLLDLLGKNCIFGFFFFFNYYYENKNPVLNEFKLIISAIKKGYFEIVELLLSKIDIKLLINDISFFLLKINNDNPLLLATKNNFMDIVQLLIQNGVNINYIDSSIHLLSLIKDPI